MKKSFPHQHSRKDTAWLQMVSEFLYGVCSVIKMPMLTKYIERKRWTIKKPKEKRCLENNVSLEKIWPRYLHLGSDVNLHFSNVKDTA